MSRVLRNLPHVITSVYGKRGNSFHGGVDLTGVNKKQIRVVDAVIAHSDGTVITAISGKHNDKTSKGTASYGNLIVIQHDDEYKTYYAHLANVYVKAGQCITKGQEIGYMGNTGNSHGAHLHFEVRQGNTRVDPTTYLDADLPHAKKEEIDKVGEKRYNKVDELPDYYQKDIQHLIDLGTLKGDLKGNLNLSEDMVRVLVVVDRLYSI